MPIDRVEAVVLRSAARALKEGDTLFDAISNDALLALYDYTGAEAIHLAGTIVIEEWAILTVLSWLKININAYKIMLEVQKRLGSGGSAYMTRILINPELLDRLANTSS